MTEQFCLVVLSSAERYLPNKGRFIPVQQRPLLSSGAVGSGAGTLELASNSVPRQRLLFSGSFTLFYDSGLKPACPTISSPPRILTDFSAHDTYEPAKGARGRGRGCKPRSHAPVLGVDCSALRADGRAEGEVLLPQASDPVGTRSVVALTLFRRRHNRHRSPPRPRLCGSRGP